MNELGRLEQVPLRDAWVHEARNFTKWLAEDDNLDLLGEALNLNLSLVDTEVSVGRYSADILAQDEQLEIKVVIENQLETTNHDHLGKIITYAAGSDSRVVVWIVKDAREEHQKAIEWLNDNTVEDLSFFLVQIELWKIGDSISAPRFNVLEAPNQWGKSVRSKSSSDSITSNTKLLQLEFWEAFREFAADTQPAIVSRKAHAQHWYNLSAGSSSWHIALTIKSFGQMGCEIYIPHNKQLFQAFYSQREAIESQIKETLDWQPLPDKKACRIIASSSCNLEDKTSWPILFAWMLDQAVTFKVVFGSAL
jgi:Domain of unknown function (DUF4268)